MDSDFRHQIRSDPRQGFPGGTEVMNSPANAGDVRDVSSIPGSGRSPGVGDASPL